MEFIESIIKINLHFLQLFSSLFIFATLIGDKLLRMLFQQKLHRTFYSQVLTEELYP